MNNAWRLTLTRTRRATNLYNQSAGCFTSDHHLQSSKAFLRICLKLGADCTYYTQALSAVNSRRWLVSQHVQRLSDPPTYNADLSSTLHRNRLRSCLGYPLDRINIGECDCLLRLTRSERRVIPRGRRSSCEQDHRWRQSNPCMRSWRGRIGVMGERRNEQVVSQVRAYFSLLWPYHSLMNAFLEHSRRYRRSPTYTTPGIR